MTDSDWHAAHTELREASSTLRFSSSTGGRQNSAFAFRMIDIRFSPVITSVTQVVDQTRWTIDLLASAGWEPSASQSRYWEGNNYRLRLGIRTTLGLGMVR